MRLPREIDKGARIAFFVDDVIAITTISLMPKSQADRGLEQPPATLCTQPATLCTVSPKACIQPATLCIRIPQAGVAALNFFGYINAFLLMLVVIIWARVLHSRLHHALICTPHTRLEPRTTSSHLFATHETEPRTTRSHLYATQGF